jgi:hypothetical protein
MSLTTLLTTMELDQGRVQRLVAEPGDLKRLQQLRADIAEVLDKAAVGVSLHALSAPQRNYRGRYLPNPDLSCRLRGS